MDWIRTNGLIGTDQVRVDGIAKVTGQARYGADQAIPNAAHAVLVMSPIARGRISDIDQSRARAMPGLLEILTYKNVGKRIKPGKPLVDGGYMSHAVAPLRSDRIYFSGQIVAVAIAESLETAQAAAEALHISYKQKGASSSFDSPGSKEVKADALGETELSAGDLKKGFEQASAIVDAWYETPAQHHNPMELFQVTCAWEGDKVTVYESTQNVRGFQQGLAKQLGIKPANVRILSEVIGGAFGSRGEMGHHTSLVAYAARLLGRPVKLVASRSDGFTLRTFRAETRHHVRLGADARGQLTALHHDAWEVTSRKERFAVAGSDSTARLYACPNVETKVTNVEVDRQAPGFMRAPPETPYMFAMESAMDELSYELGIDPVDLRQRNDTMVETVTGLPYTSRSLLRCIEKGAEIFGWSKRPPLPRSMSEGDDLIGWGFASAFYPAQTGPAHCRLTLTPGLQASVEIGTHEIGTGIRTVIAQTVSDLLGISMDAVHVHIGDSKLPAAPMSAGSNTTASVCSVVGKACEALRAKIAAAAVKAADSPLHGLDEHDVRLMDGFAAVHETVEPLANAVRRAGKGRALIEKATHTPHGAPPVIGPALVSRGKPVMLGGSRLKDRMQFAHGAHFVEVRVDRWTGAVRVPRMLGVFAAGRIMNARTAKSQLAGGQVWGVSSALLESTELDEKLARYVNQDLAEYHVAVNADIGDVQTIMLDETDTLVNPLGIKGVGEIGITGANAAIANAVFHATGVRIRKLPIRLDKVLLRQIA